MIPGNTSWSPTLSITSAQKDSKLISQGKKLGVNFAFGTPVTDAVYSPQEVPWPKQLVLSRTFKVEHYPQVSLDWSKYPFDSQELTIVLSEESLEPGLLELDIGSMQFGHDKASVGDAWTKESASYEIVDLEGRQALKLSVRVKRDPKGKVYSLFLPCINGHLSGRLHGHGGLW